VTTFVEASISGLTVESQKLDGLVVPHKGVKNLYKLVINDTYFLDKNQFGKPEEIHFLVPETTSPAAMMMMMMMSWKSRKPDIGPEESPM
jgi:hypothetical protein